MRLLSLVFFGLTLLVGCQKNTWVPTRDFKVKQNPWYLVPGPISMANVQGEKSPDSRQSPSLSNDSNSSEAIGHAGAGCLIGGHSLLDFWNSNFDRQSQATVLFPERKRHYAHEAMVHFLQMLSVWCKENRCHLWLGDVSLPRGGPMVYFNEQKRFWQYGHASHQIGLDIDLFWERQGTAMVKSTNQLSPRWQQQGGPALLYRVASDERVERIFVDPLMKRHMCEDPLYKHGAFTSKIRPWFGHADHMHVRLKCPPGNTACESNTPPVPEPNAVADCGDQLDWWFSPEAMLLKQRPAMVTAEDQEPQWPQLPDLCRKVLFAKPNE